MKRFLFALVLMMFFVSNSFAIVRNIQDNYKMTYMIIDASGNHVEGQSPLVQIQRASDGYWFDFNDSTFKSSEWNLKTTTLTEDSTNGFYYYIFNPPASETSAEEYIFLVDNADIIYRDRQSMSVVYQNIGTSTLVETDNIGINWADVDNQMTTVALSGTTIGVVTTLTTWDKTGYSLSEVGIDSIWDEEQSGHVGEGSFGKYLDTQISSGSSVDPWLTEIPGTYTGDQAGRYLPDLIKKSRGR